MGDGKIPENALLTQKGEILMISPFCANTFKAFIRIILLFP